MPTEPIRAPFGVNVPGSAMAGFQLTLYGRFWVTPEALGRGNGYPFTPTKKILVANPASFVAQKILIHHERNYKDRTKDLLYVHDTIDVISEHLAELHEIYSKEIRPQLHKRRVMELRTAGNGLFGKVNDTIREAALMAAGRKLTAEALAETGRAGLKEIFK